MDIFCNFIVFWDDIWQDICHNKRRFALCLLLVIVGVVVGVVVASNDLYSQFHYSRLDIAVMLLFGTFFKVFFWLIKQSVLLCASVVVGLLDSCCCFIPYVVVFVMSVMLGGTACAMVIHFGVSGVLFIIEVVFLLLLYALVLFLFSLLNKCKRTVCECFCQSKQITNVIIMCICANLLLIFVILRLLTVAI